MATEAQVEAAAKRATTAALKDYFGEENRVDDINAALFDGVPRPAVTHVPGVMPEPNEKWRRLDNLTALSEVINRVTGYRVKAEHLAQWGLPADPRIVGQDLLIELLVRARDAAKVVTLSPQETAILTKIRSNTPISTAEKGIALAAFARIAP